MIHPLSTKFRSITDELSTYVIDRVDVIQGLQIAILSDANILMLGAPGIAKSYVARQFSNHISGAKWFERLITKFTTPDELFGAPDLMKLKEEREFVRDTRDMLPETNIGFLDEVFKGNSSILNTLLTLMNEKLYHNGRYTTQCPLYTLIGASNEVPSEEDGLNAFYDRFMIRFVVESLKEPGSFMTMLSSVESAPVTILSGEDIILAKQEARKVVINQDLLNTLFTIKLKLEHAGIIASDRTYKKCIPIVKASAFLNDRTTATDEDLEFLQNVLWSDPNNRQKVQQIVLEIVNPAKKKLLEMVNKSREVVDEYHKKSASERQSQLQETLANLRKIKAQAEQVIADKYKNKDINEIDPGVKQILSTLNGILTTLVTQSRGISTTKR